jgi:hypothetical protein
MEAAKERLNELCRQRKLPEPKFHTKAAEGSFSSVARVAVREGKVLRVEPSVGSTKELAEEAAAEAFLAKYGEKTDIWWAVVRSKSDRYAQFLSEICQRLGEQPPRYVLWRGNGRLTLNLCGRSYSATASGEYPKDVRHMIAGQILKQIGAISEIVPRYQN